MLELGVTVAVKVIGNPLVDGLSDELKAVCVAITALTTWLNGALVLLRNQTSPPYDAVIE